MVDPDFIIKLMTCNSLAAAACANETAHVDICCFTVTDERIQYNDGM